MGAFDHKEPESGLPAGLAKMAEDVIKLADYMASKASGPGSYDGHRQHVQDWSAAAATLYAAWQAGCHKPLHSLHYVVPPFQPPSPPAASFHVRQVSVDPQTGECSTEVVEVPVQYATATGAPGGDVAAGSIPADTTHLGESKREWVRQEQEREEFAAIYPNLRKETAAAAFPFSEMLTPTVPAGGKFTVGRACGKSTSVALTGLGHPEDRKARAEAFDALVERDLAFVKALSPEAQAAIAVGEVSTVENVFELPAPPGRGATTLDRTVWRGRFLDAYWAESAPRRMAAWNRFCRDYRDAAAALLDDPSTGIRADVQRAIEDDPRRPENRAKVEPLVVEAMKNGDRRFAHGQAEAEMQALAQLDSAVESVAFNEDQPGAASPEPLVFGYHSGGTSASRSDPVAADAVNVYTRECMRSGQANTIFDRTPLSDDEVRERCARVVAEQKARW